MTYEEALDRFDEIRREIDAGVTRDRSRELYGDLVQCAIAVSDHIALCAAPPAGNA